MREGGGAYDMYVWWMVCTVRVRCGYYVLCMSCMVSMVRIARKICLCCVQSA